MTLRFEYQTFPAGNTERKKRPMIKVTLKGREELTIDGIIDSGSDKTISHELFGRDIGIIFEDAKLAKQIESENGVSFHDQVIGLNNVPV